VPRMPQTTQPSQAHTDSSGAGTCSLSRVPAATWPYLFLLLLVGSRGDAMLFKVLP
jgi:hypothetical protein